MSEFEPTPVMADESLKTRLGRTVAKLALAGTVLTMPHGPADMFMDATQDPTEVVAESSAGRLLDETPDQQYEFGGHTILDAQMELDGNEASLHFTDESGEQHVEPIIFDEEVGILEGVPLSTATEAIEESMDVREATEMNAPLEAAIERVSATVTDLDEHNDEKINQRADEFRNTNNGELVTESELEAFYGSIENSASDQDTIQMLNDFLAPYGIDAKTIDLMESGLPRDPAELAEKNREVYREYAKQIAKTMSLFPTSKFKEIFTLDSFVFNNGLMYFSDGRTAGRYDGTEINLDTSNSAPSNVVEHELTHAWKGTTSDLTPVSDSWLKYPVEYLGATLGGENAHNSRYGASNAEENRAEIGAELLRDGIKHPDRGVEFNSTLNEKLVAMLVQYDVEMPGFSDWLISRTMIHDEADQFSNTLYDVSNDVILEPNAGESRQFAVAAGLLAALIVLRKRK